MNKKIRKQHVWDRSEEELDAMSAEFDREFVADTFGPPPPAIKRRLARARRKRGRPRVGDGAQAISVTVEKSLLRRIDRLVKRRKTTRAAIIRRGMEAMLRTEASFRRNGAERKEAGNGRET